VIAGGTQPRTVITNALVAPNKTVEVPTRCVHSTRAIMPRAKLEPVGLVPRSIAFDLTSTSDTVNQHQVWSNVSCLLGTIIPVFHLSSTAFYDVANDSSTSWKAAKTDLTKAIRTFTSVAKKALEVEKKYAKRRGKPSWYRRR